MLNNAGIQQQILPQFVSLAYDGIQIVNPQSHSAQKEEDQVINSVLKTPTQDKGGSSIGQAQFYPRNVSSSPAERQLKLEMEEFLDLSQFQSPTMAACNSIPSNLFLSNADELNTPVIDMKYPFDFNNTQRTQQNIYETYQPILDTYNNNNMNIKNENVIQLSVEENTATNMQQNNSDTVITTWDVSNADDMLHMSNLDYKISSVGSYNSENTNNSILFSPDASEIGEVNKYSKMINDFDDDDVAFMPTVQNFNDIFLNSDENIQSTENVTTEVRSPAIMYETPEDSNCSSAVSTRSTPKLTLNIDAATSMLFESDIKTSDVIDTIDDLTTNPFNIGFCNDEIIDYTDDLSTLPTIPELHTDPNPIPSTSTAQIQHAIPSTPPRKSTRRHKRNIRYDNDDDDEDYVPSPKRRATSSTSYIKLEVDSDESDEELEVRPVKRRGRPPKRTSISSEDYGNSPQSKYRELRDKNNEASRKSRLKRKQKELAYEHEADELIDRNRKLKCEVSELERLVSTMRKDLMMMMLAKR